MQESVERFLRNISNCHLKCTNIPEQGRFFSTPTLLFLSGNSPNSTFDSWTCFLTGDQNRKRAQSVPPHLALPPLSCAMPALWKPLLMLPLKDAGDQVITYLCYHLVNALLPQKQEWWGQRLNEMYSKAVKKWGCIWWTMETVTHAVRLQSFLIAESVRRCISILLKAHYYL